MDSAVFKKLNEAYSHFIKRDEKISVASLCKKAQVARATFYLHFNTLEDFSHQSNMYILSKFIKQTILLLKAQESNIDNVIKKENIIFEDYEIVLLKYYTEGNYYLSFLKAFQENDINEIRKYLYEKFGNDFVIKNCKKLEFFLNGFLTITYLNIIDYNEERFKFEMHHCFQFEKQFLNHSI